MDLFIYLNIIYLFLYYISVSILDVRIKMITTFMNVCSILNCLCEVGPTY